MPKYKIIHGFYVVTLLMESVLGILASGAIDLYSVKGSTAILPCFTNLSRPVLWIYDKAREVEFWKALDQASLQHRYSITADRSRGQYNLTIKGVQLEDAGTYRCVDDEGFGYDQFLEGFNNNVATAELGVVEENLNCWSSTANQYLKEETFDSDNQPCGVINMRCNMSFGGNIPPTLQWSLSPLSHISGNKTRSLQRFTRNTVTTIGENKRISSEVILGVSRWVNQSYITCKVTGLGMKGGQIRNQPIFTQSEWKSDKIIVGTLDTGHLVARKKCTTIIESNVKITGITIVDDELFVIKDASSVINIYDSHSLTLSRNISVGMTWPVGIAGSEFTKALYVIDSHRDCNCIHKVDLIYGSVSRLVEFRDKHWPWGISVTSSQTILVTMQIESEPDYSVIIEYSNEGTQLREINLNSIQYAYDTIKLSDDEFIVSHGKKEQVGSADSKHRVCLVNSGGQIVKFYGSTAGRNTGQLSSPKSITLDKDNKRIYVADFDNNRIIILDNNLAYLGELNADLSGGFNAPHRLHFDSTTDRLFVGEKPDHKGGRLLVINT